MERADSTADAEDYTPGHVFTTDSRRSRSLSLRTSLSGAAARQQISGTDSPIDVNNSSRGEVKLRIGADDSNVEILEPVPEDRRLYMEYAGVSAWVPSMFDKPSLLPKINLRRGAKKIEDKKSSMRKVGETCQGRSLFIGV